MRSTGQLPLDRPSDDLSLTTFYLSICRAQYGYDVNSPQFKEWQAQQQQQYAQYYAQQGYAAGGGHPQPNGDNSGPAPTPPRSSSRRCSPSTPTTFIVESTDSNTTRLVAFAFLEEGS
jgi:hypothetical protein